MLWHVFALRGDESAECDQVLLFIVLKVKPNLVVIAGIGTDDLATQVNLDALGSTKSNAADIINAAAIIERMPGLQQAAGIGNIQQLPRIRLCGVIPHIDSTGEFAGVDTFGEATIFFLEQIKQE